MQSIKDKPLKINSIDIFAVIMLVLPLAILKEKQMIIVLD